VGDDSLGLMCTENQDNGLSIQLLAMQVKMLYRLNVVPLTYYPRMQITTRLCRYARAIKVKKSSVHRSPAITILSMEQHVLPIMVDICSSRRHQTIPIAGLEQRLSRTSVRARHRRCSSVVNVVVLVCVTVCREEQVPGAFAVEEIWCFDDAFVGTALVV
jgi:hypothetical protein